MRYYTIFLLLLTFSSCKDEKQATQQESLLPHPAPIALVIHGGVGTMNRSSITPEQKGRYHATLKLALDTGYAALEKGASSVDVVLKVVQILENSPLFNAGRGAVFTHEGINELDASIMDGKNLMAGAVAGLKTVKNPILAAHSVMTQSDHVMLAGAGAENFAREKGLEMVAPSYFFDSTRYKQLQESIKRQTAKEAKFGTVGCVALDQFGNIAAGTSTGGITNKKYGRIGDSPVIGAGVYANNATCGVSSTGWGEYFIRLAVAFDISALIEYKGMTLEEASAKVIKEKLPALGGDGGVIGLTRSGEIVMMFNTEGMYRGYRRKGEEAKTFIYNDED